MSGREKDQSWIREPRLWLIFLIYLLVGGISFNRSLFLSEEGYHLYFAWLLARGDKLYRDFQLLLPPFSYLVKAGLIKIFGFQLIVLRIYTVLLGILGFFCIAYLSRKVVSSRFWLLGPCLYIFYSNNLLNFAHYSIDSRVFWLISFSLFLAWAETRKLSLIFLSGFFAGMTSLSYQTFIFLFPAELLGVFWLLRKGSAWRIALLVFLAGFLILPAIWGIYLVRSHLVMESFQALILAGAIKRYNFKILLNLIYPGIIISAIITILLKKLRGFSKMSKILLAFLLILLLILARVFSPAKLAEAGRDFLILGPHLVSLILPVALFALAGLQLVETKAGKIPMLAFIISVLFFGIGPVSGYDLAHNLSNSILILPWIGFLAQSWKESSRRTWLGISPAGMILILFLFGTGIFLFLTRWELNGEVEPIYRATARLDLESARWIYTSEENKQDLERLVKEIQKRTGPEDKILVYPHHLLIYPLAGRVSFTGRSYFYFELADQKELERAVDLALKDKTLVIFQLKNGKIFQPMASEKADQLIEKLILSCREKILLKNYLICDL